MKYFDDHPLQFRLLFGAGALFLLVLAAFNLHHSASYQTDENLFITSPSQLYVTQSFPAQAASNNKLKAEGEVASQSDSILVGDMLLRINEQTCDSVSTAQKILVQLAAAHDIEFLIFRPTRNHELRFNVKPTALPSHFLREIPRSVLITEVFENGASERAGMLVGDVILSINGQRFRDSAEADRIMRQAEANRATAYEVLRDNRVITLHVTLARYATTLATFLIVLIGLSFWGLALFLGFSRPQLFSARLLALALLVLSFPIMMLVPRASNPGFLALTARALFPISVLLSFALMMHGSAYFPKTRPELLRQHWPIVTPYGLAVLSFLLAFFGVLPLISGIMMLGVFSLALHFRFRRDCPPEYTRQNRILKWAGIGAALLSIILTVNMIRASNYQQYLGYTLVPFLLLPPAYLYTIGRSRIFDMNLRVGLNVQYQLISWFWGLLLLGGFIALLFALPQLPIEIPNLRLSGSYLEIIDEPLPAEQKLSGEKIVLMLIAIALVFLYRRFHRSVQDFLSRKFYRAGYDYRRAVNELSELMATQLTMLDLAKGIARKLAEHIQLKRVGVLFFRDQKECSCHEAHGFEADEWTKFCVTIDQPLINTLQKFRSESRFSSDYLPPALKEQFHQSGFVHILPIRFKDKLVGALLVGEKLSEAGFHEEDLHYLAAVAKQASLAIENASLYEELAEKERMKHELEIARRIQLASLPQTTPRVPGLDIAGISIPALEVGGDYFDYLNGKPDQITVIVGDVSGKGTSAALYMSKVQGILRSLHDFGLSPRELFIRANHLLRDALDRSSFVTSIGACFEASTRKLRLARAGHLPLYHYQARTGSIDRITPKGLGLGLDDDRLFAAELEERSVSYETGDVFLFVTDGVTEAQGESGGEFGEESLTEILSKKSTEPAQRIRDHVVSAVKSFVNDEYQHDDLTLVVVKAV